MNDELADKIVSLWRSPKFYASFSGLNNFKLALEREKGIHVSYNNLMRLMLKQPEYVTSLRPIRRFPRRHETVYGYGKLFEADIAFMPPHGTLKCFLACIDVFSRKIFARALPDAKASTVKKALESIFEEAKITPERLSSDQGSEFKANKAFFKAKKIYFHYKVGANKASYAEHSVYVIKRRLYRLLKTIVSDNWPKYIGQIVT